MARRVKKGDEVLVMRGAQRGKKGKVLQVLADKERVIVEGLNMIKKHCRPNAQMKQGGIIEKEGPIHQSNVRVIVVSGDQK